MENIPSARRPHASQIVDRTNREDRGTATQPIEYEDFPGHSPEFDKLLTDRFGDLSDDGKAEILGFIDNGPDLSGFKKRKESEGKPATEEEIAEFADYWRLQWLHKIRTKLDTVRTEMYSTLVARFGNPRDHDSSGGIHSWVGPTSPKSPDELAQMSSDELISFLKTGTQQASGMPLRQKGLDVLYQQC